jgi:hypothetical protein
VVVPNDAASTLIAFNVEHVRFYSRATISNGTARSIVNKMLVVPPMLITDPQEAPQDPRALRDL